MDRLSLSDYLRDFLGNYVSDADTVALAKLILKRDHQKAAHALEDLVKHIQNPWELFTRRKIVKSTLLSYIRISGLVPPSDATKETLIALIINHWESQLAQQWDSQQQQLEDSTDATWQQQQIVSFDASHGAQVTRAANDVSTYDDGAEDTPASLALQFCSVFFAGFHDASFSNDLFFDDCVFTLAIVTSGHEEVLQGSTETVTRLYGMLNDDEVLLRHNSTSVNGFQEGHGCLGVVAQGTVHRPGVTLGLFDSKFLLAQDPHLNDTWRVQTMEIQVSLKQTAHS